PCVSPPEPYRMESAIDIATNLQLNQHRSVGKLRKLELLPAAAVVKDSPTNRKESMMRLNEIMSRNVVLTDPADTLQQAALAMAELDVGVLPVGDGDRLIGMITDRDIAVRGDATGCDPKTTPVSQVMSQDTIRYCFEEDDVDDVARNMAELQVR